jgi:DNA-binding transcriptional ArsR family regulator
VEPFAHIGNIPVEEWLPFLFPVLALYVYGRHWSRRRREAVRRLPGPRRIDDTTAERVTEHWRGAGHREVSREHIPLLYPPGPDGASAAELAERTGERLAAVERRLAELQELGYVDVEERKPHPGSRAWLTDEGFELVNLTEDALLDQEARDVTEPARG